MSTPTVEAILVDTDVYSYLMNGTGYASIYKPHVQGKLVSVSFVTVGELYFGAYRKNWGQDRLADLKDRLRSVTIVPYDEAVCRTYAELKSAMHQKGDSISDNDLWIASCAVRHGIPLVSNNERHFRNVPGLVLRTEAQAVREMQSQSKLKIEATVSNEPKAPS